MPATDLIDHLPRLLPGPAIHLHCQFVPVLTNVPVGEVSPGVFMGKEIDESQIIVQLEGNDLATEFEVMRRLLNVQHRDRQMRIAPQIRVFLRIGFHTQKDALSIPEKPNWIDLRVTSLIHRREMAECGAVENVMKALRDRRFRQDTFPSRIEAITDRI